MNTTQTSSNSENGEIVNKSSDKEINDSCENVSRERIEALVTPEQVRSDSVARRRRTFTKKKQNEQIKRDQTPLRDVDDKTTTTDEEMAELIIKPERPKTPERRKRKLRKSKYNKATKSEAEITDSEKEKVIRSSSIPPQLYHQNGSDYYDDYRKLFNNTKESIYQTQVEVRAFFSKTKKSITAAAIKGKERFRKMNKEEEKRSQSVPYSFTQEELNESLRRANLLNGNKYRKYSDSSVMSSTVSETPIQPKPFRAEVQEFIRQRKKPKIFSTKIIEILDPKTSKVLATKTIIKPTFHYRELFTVLRTFSIKELRTHYKAFKIDMKDECKTIRLLRNQCFMDLFLIMIFCGLGGILFRFVEGSFENFYKCGVRRVKRDFIDMLWTRSHNLREEDWKSLARNKLRTFEEELHTAHEAGVKTYSGQRSWSFLNAVVYCLSIVTTIGYGHIYPDTRTGKALTIVYAIVGIPLFLLALTDFGKLFTRCIKFLWSFVRRLYYTGSCRSVRKTAHVQEIFKGAQMMYEIATFRRPSHIDPNDPDPENPSNQVGDDTPTTPALSNFEIDDEFNLPISLAIFILIVYILLGALIYCIWERWGFFDSFYFVFISMSTVGFGDMVPDDPACMIVSIVYLVFGLALMSMCINVVQLKLSDTFKQASTKIGATLGVTVQEEDGSITTVPPEAIEVPPVHKSGGVESSTPSTEGIKDEIKDDKKDS